MYILRNEVWFMGLEFVLKRLSILLLHDALFPIEQNWTIIHFLVTSDTLALKNLLLLLLLFRVDAANATAISTAKKWGAATSNRKKLSLKWTEADYFYYQEHYFTCNIACVGRYLRWHSRKWSMAFKLHVHLARKSGSSSFRISRQFKSTYK